VRRCFCALFLQLYQMPRSYEGLTTAKARLRFELALRRVVTSLLILAAFGRAAAEAGLMMPVAASALAEASPHAQCRAEERRLARPCLQ